MIWNGFWHRQLSCQFTPIEELEKLFDDFQDLPGGTNRNTNDFEFLLQEMHNVHIPFHNSFLHFFANFAQ